jgi:hypothetical protein
MTVDRGLSVHLLRVGATNLKILKNFLTVVMLGTWCPVITYALDPFVVGAGGGGQFSWKIQFAEGASDLFPSTTSIGVVAPLLGQWQDELSVATLTRGIGLNLVLKHPTNTTGVDIGPGYYILAGGDFEGTGRSGVALAQRSKFGSGILWQVVSDPLHARSVYTVPGVGRPGDIPFYFKGAEGRDLLSVLRGSGKGLYRQVLAADVVSGQRQIIRLSDPVRGVVKVSGIRLRNGAGGIFVQTQADYRIYSATGQFLVWGNTGPYANGTIAIGDYLSDEGDEVAVLNADDGEVSVLNPFNENKRVIRVGSGTSLHDESAGLVVNDAG